MKIAVPVTNDKLIDSHFGHCESYGIYSVSEKNEITDIKTVESSQGCGCKSGIASDLAADGVTVLLAGGIGNGAISVLNSHGIEVIRGCSGNADDVVKLYLSGMVSDSGSSCHQHEAHHNTGHSCSHN